MYYLFLLETFDRMVNTIIFPAQNIISQRAAADIYASLATTALDSATNLQEQTSRIDVRKDAEELK